MGITSKREAVLAASFVRRSKLTNSTAIENLGRFHASLDRFDEDYDADWDTYRDRVKAERDEADTSDIAKVSLDTGISPMQVIKDRQKARIEELTIEAAPTLRVIPVPVALPAAYTDPSSVDYRDPDDFYRTLLIKASIDDDIKLVQELVEERSADLFVRDIEGNNAYQNAINYGNEDTAVYLKAKMDACQKRKQA